MSVLLVDTVDGDATVLASALRVEGFEVTLVASAREAREVLATKPVQLTIVDLMLRSDDGSNGLDLAREFRRGHPGTRVLLTSSYHLSERQLERADCGVSGFIPKPYDLREVVEFVRAKLNGPPSSRRFWCAEPRSGISPSPIPPAEGVAAPAPAESAVAMRLRR
jgi:DNA-binding response OmpR family regulator